MSTTATDSVHAGLPEGYVAIPTSEQQSTAVLKICALARIEPDPAGGQLVVLRNTLDATVFLGCIVDAAGCVHEWHELWVQNTDALISSASAGRLSLSNSTLDDRWRRQCQAFGRLDEAAMIMTASESAHPAPVLLDLSARCPIHPREPNSGDPLRLCTDEGLLQQKGLPGYGASLHRYLYVPALGPESPFVPVTSGAATNDSTRSLADVCGDIAALLPFNPQAGLMLVKIHAPIDLETFTDILNGGAWDGLKHGRSVLELGRQFAALRKDQPVLTAQGRLLLETHGRCGRVTETFHLKLRLLADIVSAVHSMVAALQRPLLNISPENWQVQIAQPGHGLPVLWTARAVLGDPGDAVALPIEKSDLQYFLPSTSGDTSVYRPVVPSLPTRGHASVRIRRVLPDIGDDSVIEGTFATQERIAAASRDLAWFRLNLSSGPINLHAHLEADSAMAPGEWRFRTVPRNINETELWSLRGAEGVPMPDIPFEIIPLLSSPCDLYSLAVMAVRLFLVDKTNTLPEALDETLSLARQIETAYDQATDLESRISTILETDSRWVESLGPQHLTFDEMTPQQAFALIPAELWWSTLAAIVTMFPGVGPQSRCKDYGDAEPKALQKVFEQTIADLDRLILRTRSLIVADWKSNQEVSAVIQKYLA